jgi:coproporphyrinogen III oxidase-like Fe-S oxidoreductase
MQSECQALLAESGFEQYEVSAYAREGARCRHNLNYWRSATTSASAPARTAKSLRACPTACCAPKSRASRATYLEQVGIEQSAIEHGGATGARGESASEKPVPASDLPFEFMLNALRLNEGFALADFESRTGLGASAVEPGCARRLTRPGRVRRRRWRPASSAGAS